MSLRSCHVTYWGTRSIGEQALGGAVALLSPDERARHARFVPAHARRDFAAAHALLRVALSARIARPPRDWRFVADARGKPRITAAGSDRSVPAFNLSHTDGVVACAVSADRGIDVGVDVERIDRRVEALDLAQRYFSCSEIRALEDCAPADRAARFIDIWTLKEAFVKAVGDGLACPLDGFGFVFDDPASIRLETLIPAGRARWQFGLFRVVGDYRLAVAVRNTSTKRCRLLVGQVDPCADAPVSGKCLTLLRSSKGLDIAGATACLRVDAARDCGPSARDAWPGGSDRQRTAPRAPVESTLHLP